MLSCKEKRITFGAFISYDCFLHVMFWLSVNYIRQCVSSSCLRHLHIEAFIVIMLLSISQFYHIFVSYVNNSGLLKTRN